MLFRSLGSWLAEITGFAKTSLQPISGAQGEYAGLMTIRAYHHANGEHQRDITIVPSSAHGTNPASGGMAGMKAVVTRWDDNGKIDLDELRENVGKYSERRSGVVVAYSATHGTTA